MASAFIKSNRMKRTESKKSHSWWWDSHISPNNSKWLQENLGEMDQHIKRMLKLIEEDADSFAKKAELYFKKRPELITLVEDFYRMYRALAERYDHVTGELRKNIPSDLQSHGSSISDLGSEPPSTTMLSPDWLPSRTKSGPRATGFDVFLGSDKSSSELNTKEGDESSTLDSESESDDSSVNNYPRAQSNGDELGFRRRVCELEAELRDVKEKLIQLQNEERSDHRSSEVSSKIGAYEEELRVARENMRQSEEEIMRLTLELQKYKSLEGPNNSSMLSDLKFVESKQNQFNELREVMSDSEKYKSLEGPNNSNMLPDLKFVESKQNQVNELREVMSDSEAKEELRIMQEKLRESEEEVASLREELRGTIENFQDQLKSAQKEVPIWKNKLEKEKREVSKLQDRMARYKNNLSDRDQEIRGLKEAISNANKMLSEENEQLKAEVIKITKGRTYLEDNLKEQELRCQSLEEDVRRANASKAEMEVLFRNQIEQLKAGIAQRDVFIEELKKMRDELKLKYDTLIVIGDDLNAEIAAKDGWIAEMREHLGQLHMEQAELIAGADVARKSAEELRMRVEELEMEVERKQETILEGAEKKREAIRQLCFSLLHYRTEYNELLRSVMAYRRPAVMET